MLNSVEHEKSFITSGLVFVSTKYFMRYVLFIQCESQFGVSCTDLLCRGVRKHSFKLMCKRKIDLDI